jgi:uncharacterized repeat protein (TIGR03803 family)
MASLIEGLDGNLYGSTAYGGTVCLYGGCGTLFKITPAGTLTTLYSFDRSDGDFPVVPLTLATDGNFYGTVWEGGAYSDGTVIRLTPEGALTTLHEFDYTDGYNPWGLIQASDGNFYGTTCLGGSKGAGTVFRITSEGVLTALHNFNFPGPSGGSYPSGGLVQATNGNFYGVTLNEGASGDGTIFEITPAGKLTTLYNFQGSDGSSPTGLLIQASNGNYYGATYMGAPTTSVRCSSYRRQTR